MNKYLRILLGILISVFFLWMASRSFDPATVSEALQTIRWKWILAAVFIYITGHFLRSYRWSLLLNKLHPVKVLSVFPILMFGFLVNNFIPGRAGEFARALAVSKRFNIPTVSALGTIALERMGDLTGLLTVLLIALQVFEPAKRAFPSVVASLFFLTITFLLILKYLPRIKSKLNKTSLTAKIFEMFEKLVEGIRSANSWQVVAGVILTSILVWLGEGLTLILVARSFDLHLSVPQASATLSGISMGVIIPASPGFVGTYEFFGKEALRILGFPAGISLVLVGFLHLFQIVICSLLGLPYLFQWGTKTDESGKSS